MKRTHGLSHTREYNAWTQIKRRCLNAGSKDYPKYGGRGICICDRWLSYQGFFADMGHRPSDLHSVERINNDGNYEPGNCRWATKREQANNQRKTTFVTYRGERMSLSEAWRAAGCLVARNTAVNRFSRGWSPEAAVETPNTYRRDPVTRKIIRDGECCHDQ